MGNASVEKTLVPEILREAVSRTGYTLEKTDKGYVLKGAGKVESEVYQRNVEEVMANVSDALVDRGVWNSPQVHEIIETLAYSFHGFNPDSTAETLPSDLSGEPQETKWGFPSLVAGLFGGAAILGIGYGLAKEFGNHLPDFGQINFFTTSAAAEFPAGEVHTYQDMVSNFVHLKSGGAAAIADATLNDTELPPLHYDISSALDNMNLVFPSINGSDFNLTAKNIRGDMEKLQTPEGSVPVPIDQSINPDGWFAYQSLKSNQFPKINQTLIDWQITNRGVENIGSPQFTWPDNSTPAGEMMSGLLKLIKDDYGFYRQVEQTQKTITGISGLGIDDAHTDAPLKNFLGKLYTDTKEIKSWLNPNDLSERQKSGQIDKYFSKFVAPSQSNKFGQFFATTAQVLNSALQLIDSPDENVPYPEMDLTPPHVASIEGLQEIEAGTIWSGKVLADDLGPNATRGVDHFDISVLRPDSRTDSLNISAAGIFNYSADSEGNYIFSIFPTDKSGNKASNGFDWNFSAWKDKIAPAVSVKNDFRKSLYENETQWINFTASDDRTGVNEIKVLFGGSYYNATPTGGINYQAKFKVGAPGNKTAQIFARDGRNNTANASINFSVLETPDTIPPKIFELQGVSEGQILAPGNVTITAGARDNIVDSQRGNKPLDKVEFILDGKVYAGEHMLDDCTLSICNEVWMLRTNLGEGKHMVSARAYDLAGNVGADYPTINFTTKEPVPDNKNIHSDGSPSPLPFVALGALGALGGGLYLGMRDGVGIERVVYVHNDGRMIKRRKWVDTSGTDEEIEMGMMSAVGSFIKDAYGGATRKHQISIPLRDGRLHNTNLLFARGRDSTLVASVSGSDGENVVRRMERVIYPIEENFNPAEWDGDKNSARTAVVDPFLERIKSPTILDRFYTFADRISGKNSYRQGKPRETVVLVPTRRGPSQREIELAQQLAAMQQQLAAAEQSAGEAMILRSQLAQKEEQLRWFESEVSRLNFVAQDVSRPQEERDDAGASAARLGEELRRTRSLMEKLAQSDLGAGDTEQR